VNAGTILAILLHLTFITDDTSLMTSKNQRILIADDSGWLMETLRKQLYDDGYEVALASNGSQALRKLLEEDFAVLLIDLALPDISAVDLLSQIKQRGILTDIIIVSDKGTVSTAVDAMKKGAYDYLEKPVEPNRLKTIIMKALEHYRLVLSHRHLEQQLEEMTRFEDLIGQSNEMLHVYKLIEAVADTTANVIITGESGTGKELVARAIHKKSSRASGPFVAVNCSAFPVEILENELFGHEQGAFTGALKEKHGCFELAHKGTLFLDEVCEMPMETQAKLLRALEERRFRRLGGKDEIEVDVRVISASNRNLEEALQDKTLREDIYYRLCVVEIDLPPLRERFGDIPLLMNEFVKYFSKKNNKPVSSFSSQAFEYLNRYHWPGNVRELKNTIERAVVLAQDTVIHLRDLSKRIIGSNGSVGKLDIQIPLGTSIDAMEKKLIMKTLEHLKNNKTRTAHTLGISLKTLHNKLNLYKSEQNFECS
jgi:DNA-binding NtrC family response regulator